ncbi:MAG: spore germination protein [Candidatus Petromonas sp.]|nr:spore germination protein [Candidatus Petromonas sp.]
MFHWLKKNKKEKNERKSINLFNEKVTPLSKSMNNNLKLINKLIGHSPDVVIRSFKAGSSKLGVSIVYIDGLADEITINQQIMKPVMLEIKKIEADINKLHISEKMKETIITIAGAKTVKTMEDCVLPILSGSAVFFIDGSSEALVLSTPGWEKRSVQEPPSEPTVRGPRDGFVETLRDNIVHLRRRIRDPNFTIIEYKMGRRSKADLALIYIKGLTNEDLVNEIRRRVERIDMDMVLGSGYVEQLIEDNFLSPFPQMIITERPDKAVGALMDGFVVLILDNTPFALIVPATLPMFIQAPEDYYERWAYSSLVRVLRYFFAFIALFLPSLYVALVSFHQGLIPTRLMISIAAGREGVPFPSLIEAFIMEVTLEILREAGVRLPKPVGQAVGIVGGLVIGEAAVQANIVSPIMVVVVALTGISSFALPQYSMGIAIRMIRFTMMILAGTLGLYGIMLGYIMLNVHLVKLKSFGVNYMAPFVPYRLKDWKDLIIRAPMMAMKQRPQMIKTQDKYRKDHEE